MVYFLISLINAKPYGDENKKLDLLIKLCAPFSIYYVTVKTTGILVWHRILFIWNFQSFFNEMLSNPKNQKKYIIQYMIYTYKLYTIKNYYYY